MIENIDFIDTDNKVTVTIDNETQELPIKAINRLPIYIDLNQSLNTALENNIQLDASIYYINNETPTKLDTDGVVTVTIYNNDEIYYSKNKHFKKGTIIDDIKNTLPLGLYTMKIEYAGNKYFEPAILTIHFNIEKRLGICKFNKREFYEDIGKTISIGGTLLDEEKNTKVANCKLFFNFNGQTYTTNTDNEGEFYLTVTVPEPEADKSHCQYSDENYSNAFYIIDIYTNDAPYQLNNEQVLLVANKAKTIITGDAQESNEDNYLRIVGNVLAEYNNADNDVKYGTVTIFFPDMGYTYDDVEVAKGIFDESISLSKIYKGYINNYNTMYSTYDTTNSIWTKMNVNGDKSCTIGEDFSIEAQITTVDNEYIEEGALLFTLINQEDKIIYRYETELDSTGIGVFNFTPTVETTYKINIEYIGMFGYKDATLDEPYIIRVEQL